MPKAVVTILVRGGRNTLAELQGITRELGSAAQAESRVEAAIARTAKTQAAAAADKARLLREAATLATEERRKLLAESDKAEKERRQQLGQTEKAFTDAEKRKAKAAEAAAKKQAKAAEKAARQAEAEARRAAREQERIAQRLAREQERAAQKALRAREKAERDATRAAQREAAQRTRIEEQTLATRRKRAAEMVRRGGGMLGAAGAGVIAGGVSAMGTARGVLGVQDTATRVQRGNEFRENLLLLARQAGMSDRADEIQGKILAAAKQNAQDPLLVLEGLKRAHAEFNALDLFVDKLDEVAFAARASQSDFEDFVGIMGALQRSFGITREEFDDAIAIIAQGANTGSVEFKNFAADFKAAAGAFAGNTGQRGLEGVRQFSALSQTIATGGFDKGDSKAETATRVERIVAALNDVQVRKKLKRIGVELPEEGQPLDPGKVVSQLAKNEKFAKPSVQQNIFNELLAREAIVTAVQREKDVASGKEGAISIGTQQAVDVDEGKKFLRESFETIESEGVLELQRQAIEMQNLVIENLDDYNEQLLAVVRASNKLETSFGTLALWANAIGTLGLVTTGTSMLGKLFGGGILGKLFGGAGGALAGGAARAGTAGATVAAGGGLAAGGGGLLASLAAGIGGLGAGGIAAVLAGSAAAGLGIALGGDKLTGGAITDKIAEWMIGDDLERARSSRGDKILHPPKLPKPPGLPKLPAPPKLPEPPKPEPADRHAEALRISHEIANSAPARERTAAEKTAEQKPSKVDLRIDMHQYDHRTQVKTSVKTPHNVNVSTLSGPTPFGGL